MQTKEEIVRIPVEKQSIDGTLITPIGNADLHPAMLFLHGWNSRKDRHVRRSRRIALLGVTTLAINFRGHGDSDSDIHSISRKDSLEDAIAAYDFLALQPHIETKHIGIFGSSSGGNIAVLLAGKQNVDFLALWEPALYPDDVFTEPTEEAIAIDPNVFNQHGQTQDGNTAIAVISQFTGELLLLQSEKLDVVSFDTIKNYAHVATNAHLQYKVIAGADHRLSNPTKDEEVELFLYDWIKSILRK